MGYYPQYISDTSDFRKKLISIEHLLTMTAGFQWNEGSDRLYGNYIESAIELPMRDSPGSVFNYSSAVPHILSGVISVSSRSTTTEIATKYLFGPLNIKLTRWDTDAQGIAIGGTGLYLTARDMAKFAYLYLREGCYNGNQIVSPEWISSTYTQHVADPAYGYLWWYGGENLPRFYAWGYGGQMIFVVKALDLAVIFTAEPNVNAATADAVKNLTIDILENDILAAFE